MPNNWMEGYTRQERGTVELTSKFWLTVVALGGSAASLAFWWVVQSALTPIVPVALAFAAIAALAPPILISFFIPWSMAGMLLMKIRAQTYGQWVAGASGIVLSWYSWHLINSYLARNAVLAESGLLAWQTWLGFIGFVVIPALLWAGVSNVELVAEIRQAHLVKRYELQTKADIEILRATLIRAQEKALIGFENLTNDERDELAAVMRSLVGGMDKTLREIGTTVDSVAGLRMPVTYLLEEEAIVDPLEYLAEALSGQRSLADPEPQSTRLRERMRKH